MQRARPMILLYVAQRRVQGSKGIDSGPQQSPNFKKFKEPKNRFQGTKSASLCILAGRYDNPIPTRFLQPIV